MKKTDKWEKELLKYQKLIKEELLSHEMPICEGINCKAEGIACVFYNEVHQTRKSTLQEIKEKVEEMETMYGAHDAIDIAQEKGLNSPGLAYQQGHTDGQRQIISDLLKTLKERYEENKKSSHRSDDDAGSK